MPTNKILLLFAHPAQGCSEVNLPMFQAASGIDGITCIDLYALYPKHNIDVALEQERLRQHNIIIFLFPLYWYSTPALLKDWMDLVLEYGFARCTLFRHWQYLPREQPWTKNGLMLILPSGDNYYNHFSPIPLILIRRKRLNTLAGILTNWFMTRRWQFTLFKHLFTFAQLSLLCPSPNG